MFRLDGRVALVTGAARGIGAGIAAALEQAGAIALRNDLAGADCLVADVTDPEAVAHMFNVIRSRFGRLDILVNNAGIVRAEDIFETTLESWHAVIGSHLTGTFLCSKEAALIMRDQRAGRIIQISSVVGHQGALKGFVHYAAAKSGLLGFTKTLARTLAPYGITVNAVAPGIVETEMLRSAHGAEGVRALAATVPLGIGHVQDVAAAAVFLASDEASHITGAVLDVNGGLYFR